MKLKRILALVLAFCMVFTSMSLGAFADGENTETNTLGEAVLSGSGTEADPYLINSLEELKAFRDSVNNGKTYEGEYVLLKADIDLTGEMWTPIGTSNYDKTPAEAKMFAGNFDGGDHTITGLSSENYVPAAEETGSTEYSFGLFGYVYGANVSNVKLADVAIDCGTRQDSEGGEVYGSGVAALIGYYHVKNGATCVIDNCHVLSGTVKASNNMGGLIGHMDSQISQPEADITISGCSNAADVTTEAREAGGIIGLMNSAREGNYLVTMRGTITFENCVNSGDITSLGGDAPSAGGILGRDHNQAAGQRLKLVFDGCENSGTITVTANGETHAGGIAAGYYSTGAWLIAKNCTNTGDVVVNNPGSDVYAGGLISYGGVVELIDSTSTGSVTGNNTYVGGAQNILFLEEMDDYADTVNGNTYYLNGGTSPEYAALVDDAAGGGNFHLVETAYKNGFDFGGWYDNEDFTGEAYTALGKNVKTYYAKWIGPVARINGVEYNSIADAFAAAGDGDVIEILDKGKYSVPTGKNVTVTGVVDGVKFDMSKAVGVQASMTFNNVTFEYGNANYIGLQHAGDMVYNDCTFNGQLFLYGTSETFNNCEFNQTSNAAYNVWTYGAKEVDFNECTFNSAGKSVLIYKEGDGATFTTSVNFTDTDLVASEAVDGKAAIEMDSSLIAGINLTIDAETTATGFSAGSVSGNSLWNNKKGNDTEANNDITVVVDGQTVLEPIRLPIKVATKDELTAALAAATAGDTILLTADIEYQSSIATEVLTIDEAITLDLGGYTLTTTNGWGGLKLKGGCSLKNGTLKHTGNTAAIKAWDVVAIEDVVIDVAVYTEGKVKGGIVLQENCAGIDTIKNVTIKGDGLTNGIETYNCGNATEDVIGAMENVTIDAKGTGMLISAPCGTATNCTIKGGVTGIDVLLKGTYSATLDLVDCDVYGATQALSVHDEGKGYDYVGKIELSADDATNFTSVTPLAYAVENADDVVLNENILALMPLEGDGTKDEPFVIENFDDFILFRDTVNAGKTYEGEYVVLATDIDLKGYSDVGNTFRPIGDYSCDASFKGTFDGGNHTISGLYISGWDLDYYWGSYGCAGLFGTVENATIKNLTVTGVEIQVEGGDVAAIAGHAIGNCTFENITVTDSKIATYNNGCAGIVAWTEAGNYNFKNITVAEDVVLAGLWGSFDSSIGGVVAQLDNNGTYNFEDVIVACRLDIYNDVTAAYKYYNYRMCGMLIGRSQKFLADEPYEVDLSNVTCKNVKIIIGEWANYTYIWDDSLSYGCKRVEPGYTYGGIDVANYPDATVIMQSVTSIVGGDQYGHNGTSAEELVEQGFDSTEIEVIDLAYIARHEAELNGEYYATIEEALDEAVDGDTIILHMDINKDVTIGKSVTIDGGNFKYTGNISVSGTTSEVTVKNVNFENGTGYAITTNRIKSITVEDCTVNNYGFGFLYANKSTPTVVVKNVTVDGGNYGFHWVYGTSATLENVTMTNVTNGLLIQNYAGKTVTLKNCNLTNINIWERDGSSGVQTFKFEGNNTVSTLSTSQYAKYVLAGVDATLTAPEGLDVTADNVRYTVVYEDEAYRYEKVVKLGDDYYNSIQDAVDAANGNGTITLLKDVTEENITVNAPAVATLSAEGIVIDLDGHTLYGYIAPSNPTSLTVKNGNIVNKNDKYSAIEVNSGELTVENVNIDSERHAVRIDGAVDATINGGVYRVLVNNKVSAHTINVSGEATVTIKDGTFYGPKGTPNGSAMGGSALQSRDTAVVTVEGGYFAGGVNDTINGAAVSNVSIKGGYFDQDPTAYVATGYNVYTNNTKTLYSVSTGRAITLEAPTEVKTGDSFEVKVFVNTDDIKGVKWTLDYDSKYFTLDSLEYDNKYTNSDTKESPDIIAENGAFDKNVHVATYKFTSTGYATTGSTITLSDVEMQTAIESINEINVSAAGASVTIKVAPDYVVEVGLEEYQDYVAGTKLVLVYTDAEEVTFDYNGVQMFDVTGAGYTYAGAESFTMTANTKVYALVVEALKDNTLAAYEAMVTADYEGTAPTVTYTKNYNYLAKMHDNDVNISGTVNWNDIISVYAVAERNDYAFRNAMDVVLKADVNGDKKVDTQDASPIINEVYDK